MEQYIIKGGNPLVGDVTIGGAKNAALGILAASIMTDEDVLIDNLPDVRDINVVPRYHFQVDATLEAGQSTSISKVSVRWEQMYR